MRDVLGEPAGGDRRSIGRSNEIASRILEDPSLFGAVLGGMRDTDPLIRMHSADAAEKVTAVQPEYLAPYKAELLHLAARADQQEVRWHLAQMLPRLELNREEGELAFSILLCYTWTTRAR